MWVRSGKVENGKVVVDAGNNLKEGASVTVILQESDESVRLSPEDERELLDRMTEIQRGGGIAAEQVLAELPD